MRTWLVAALFVAAALAAANAVAATVDVDITDKNGRPLADTVVTLAPVRAGVLPSRVPEKSVIDQRHEMFVPLVVVLRKGGRLVFTNNDVTMHQVYSFSPIKQFQFVIGQGQTSAPVGFDQTGIAAIGCNIHDQMIAYAFVTDLPFAAVVDDKGRATIEDVPEGRYRAVLWHPLLPPDAARPEIAIEVSANGAKFTAALPIAPEPARGMKHMHMDY